MNTGPTGSVITPTVVRNGYGVQFASPPEVALREFTDGAGTAQGPPTEVVMSEPGELTADWRPTAAVRTREIRDDGEVLLSVDHVEGLGYLLHAVGWGRFWIADDGMQIRCEPDSPDWISLLGSQVLPLAATLRGLELFHASAVVAHERGAMLTASAGTGKTSLAAHLVRGGAELLADDALALEARDDTLVAHPSGRRLHLSGAEAGRLDLERTSRLVQDGERRNKVVLEALRTAEPTRLAAVYVLLRTQRPATMIERVASPSATRLLGSTFNLSVRTPERLLRQLDVCRRLAESTPVYVVHIGQHHGAGDVASLVDDHLSSTSARCA